MAKNHGLLDAEGIGGDVRGGDAAFGNEEFGANFDGADDGDKGLGNGPGNDEVVFAINAITGGEEDDGLGR